MKDALRAKIENGQYTVGELIVPKKYEKLVLDKEGVLHSRGKKKAPG